jgi:hypothetical protein
MGLLYASKTNASSAYLVCDAMELGVMVYAYDSKGFKKLCCGGVYAKKIPHMRDLIDDEFSRVGGTVGID